jgi:hypothetical protein
MEEKPLDTGPGVKRQVPGPSLSAKISLVLRYLWPSVYATA